MSQMSNDLLTQWKMEFVNKLVHDGRFVSYSTTDELADDWRETIEYDPRVIDEIVMSARTFIRIQTLGNKLDIDPDFIKSFIMKVAKHTAPYVQRSKPGMDYHTARDIMVDRLWNDWDYVSQLHKNHDANRMKRINERKLKNIAHFQKITESKRNEEKRDEFKKTSTNVRARISRVRRELAHVSLRLEKLEKGSH